MTQQLISNADTVREALAILSKYVPSVELRRLKPNVLSKHIKLTTEGIEEGVNFVTSGDTKYESVYTTFNHIEDDSDTVKENKALKDTDIDAYRFLLIDIDSNHPKSGSATDEELQEAKKVAESVMKYLSDEGMTQPIFSCSGNGYHMLYPIESTPTEKAASVIKNVLNHLKEQFSNDFAGVDTVVSNPARIIKIPGTVSNKGESTVDRPHRVSRIISAPNEVKLTPFSIVKTIDKGFLKDVEASKVVNVSKKIPKNTRTSNDQKSTNLVFIEDPDTWFAENPVLQIANKDEADGSIKYALARCPIRNHHENQSGSAIFWDKATGRLTFNCLHASCEGKTIEDVFRHQGIDIPKQIVSEKMFEGSTKRPFGEFQLSEKGVYYSDDKMTYLICPPIYIYRIEQNIHTNTVAYTIRYKTNGTWKENRFPASLLNSRNIGLLINFGFDYYPKMEDKLIRYLQKQKLDADVVNVHSIVGWNEDAFYLDKAYSKPGMELLSNHQSKYADYHILGSYDNWKIMIRENVLGTPSELALCIAFTPILLGFFKAKKALSMDCPVISLSGRSSTGKTTMEYLIAGVYGKPEKLVQTLNMTENALIQSLASNQGVPVIFDELGVMSDRDLSSLIYQISTGQGRSRLDSNAELIPTAQFTTAAIVSSEQPLTNYLNNSLGLRTRIVALDNIQWTKTAAASQTIKKGSTENSGQAFVRFISYFLEDDADRIFKRFDVIQKELEVNMRNHAIKNRFSHQLALIKLSSELVQEYLELTLNDALLKQLLISSYDYAIEDATENSDEEATSRLVSLLIANQHRFGEAKYTESWGVITDSVTETSYSVHKSILQTLIKKHFPKISLRNLLHSLKEQGILQCEKDRLTKRVNINGKLVATYTLIIKKLSEEPPIDPVKQLFPRQSEELFGKGDGKPKDNVLELEPIEEADITI